MDNITKPDKFDILIKLSLEGKIFLSHGKRNSNILKNYQTKQSVPIYQA